MKVIIIGAGLSGLIAAGVFKGHDIDIIESRTNSNPIENHHSILRLKNRSIEDLISCKLEEISIKKQIEYQGKFFDKANIMLSNLYSIKTNGSIVSRSIDSVDGVEETRYKINRFNTNIYNGAVHNGLKFVGIKYNKMIVYDLLRDLKEFDVSYDICISTIPLPVMLNSLYIDNDIEFDSSPIYTLKIIYNIKSDVTQTIYYPDQNMLTYRATLDKNELIIESKERFSDEYVISEKEIEVVEKSFGIDYYPDKTILGIEPNFQNYGKIKPIDEIKRKAMLLHLTKKYNIYSLGRFAIWKNVMVDDVIKDAKKIKQMVETNSVINEYDLKKGV